MKLPKLEVDYLGWDINLNESEENDLPLNSVSNFKFFFIF